MKKILLKIFCISLLIILLIGLLFYFNQEKIIFFPEKTRADFSYNFPSDFEEIFLQTNDGIKLHAMHFKVDNSKGVIYYLHGNSGSIQGWGDIAGIYLNKNYEVFILDYRGFGKSEGKIISETQFYSDGELGYEYLKQFYSESDIVIIGYSIGTGVASYLASKHQPQQLILQAPYYNLDLVAKTQYPFLPRFLLKYKFDNHLHLINTKVPISIFHGNADKVLFYEDHSKLKNDLKPTDQYITLDGQGHQAMNENEVYIRKLDELLR